MMRRFLTASILGAALISITPAIAQDVHTMSVSYADLNLCDRAGAATFTRRIDDAVASVCGEPTPGDLSSYVAMGRCRTQARAGVRPQMEQAIARAADRPGSQAIILASR